MVQLRLAIVLAVTLGAASVARADAGDVVLASYVLGEGAEHCPGEAELRSAVGARLGRDPFHADASSVARVRIDSNGMGLVARIELEHELDDVAVRAIEETSLDCQALFDATVLALSVAIEPSPPEPQVEPVVVPPEPEPVPSPPPAPETRTTLRAPTEPPTSAEEVTLARPLAVMAGAYAGGVATSIGVTAGARWSFTFAGFGLELRYHPPLTLDEVERELYAVDVSACYRVAEYHAVAVRMCSVVSGGLMRVTSATAAQPRTVRAPYFGAGLKASLVLALSETLALVASLGFEANSVSPSVFKVDSRTVFEPSGPAVQGGLSVEVTLP